MEINIRYLGTTIERLFGPYCSGDTFAHDSQMKKLAEQRDAKLAEQEARDLPQPTDSAPRPDSSPISKPVSLSSSFSSVARDIKSPFASTGVGQGKDTTKTKLDDHHLEQPVEPLAPIAETDEISAATKEIAPTTSQKRTFGEFTDEVPGEDGEENQDSQQSFTSTLSMRHSVTRREAFYQMLANASGDDWQPIGLLSTGDNHSVEDQEL